MYKLVRFQSLKLIVLTVLLVWNTCATLRAQFAGIEPDTVSQEVSLDKKKLNKYLIIGSVGYTASLVALNEVWYSGHPRESFHFFNDNKDWKQMDKVGHFYNTYQIGRIGIEAFKNTGLSDKKSYLWGSLLGVIMLTPIEVLDGFSSEYGASWGDVVANVSGSAFLYSQYMLWDEARISPKYSFSRTSLARKRPELLGDGLHEELIKDYNGMTFWWSFDIYSLLGKNRNFPKWLNIAVGYGANGMISSNDNSSRAMGYEPYRQYYLALDLDLTHIKTDSKFLKALLFVGNMIHLPSPALEFNKKEGLVFHPLHF